MSNQAAGVSVTEPINKAIDLAKRVLFQPFDIGKWFIIGFCAWLAQLGESGFSYSGNFGGGGGGGHNNPRQQMDQAWNYFMNNLNWIIPVAIAVFVFLMLFSIVITWLKSRGKFMFLHCVATNRAEVAVPWNAFSTQGNSLFLFRLVFGFIGFFTMLPLLALVTFPIISMVKAASINPASIMLTATGVLMLVAWGMVLALINKFTLDFVVPIMFMRGSRCMEAWREFWPMLKQNAGQFALYILFQILMGMVIGVMILLLVIMTCCIAGCFMAIPYVGTVLLLPVLVFEKGYKLYYFAQYGPQYDVFAAAASRLQPASPVPPHTQMP
jgi:hypothetical protein